MSYVEIVYESGSEIFSNARVRPLRYFKDNHGRDAKNHAESENTLVIEVNGTDAGNQTLVYVSLRNVLYVKEVL